MKRQISTLIKLTFIFVITFCFSTELFAQDNPYDSPVGSFIEALEYAKKPAENMRFEFTRERKSGFSIIPGTQLVKQEPYMHYLFDYTVTVSGICSRIVRETKRVNKDTNNEPFNITRSIEVRNGTFRKELTYKPNQNDIPKTGFINFADANHSDISYFAYGWLGDITKTYYKDPDSFRLVPSDNPEIFILEHKSRLLRRIYIDSQKNFNIIKWQEIRPSDNMIVLEINYEFTQTSNGIWYPSEYQIIDSNRLSNGEQSPTTIVEKTKIHSAEFNIDLPEDTFTLNFPVDTKVTDQVIGSTYIVSDSNSPEIEEN